MERIKKLQKELHKSSIEAALISKPENVRYLCGFTGTNGQLFVTTKKAFLITDFRYLSVAKKQLKKGFTVYDQKDGYEKLMGDFRKIGFEESNVTVLRLSALRKSLPGAHFYPTNFIVEKMRMIKDAEEIKIIKKAAQITDECLKKFIKTVKAGQSEDQMEWNLLSVAHEMDAEGFSFTPIICFGKDTADVHHQKEPNKYKKGDKILVDFGIKYKGYCSDMTRVFYFKKPDKDEQKIYTTVLEAQEKAIEAVKSGALLSDVDKAARQVIEEAGYGERFGHSAGHGLGLKVHEGPRVDQRTEEKVQSGMVFTIEPGIYIEKKGGVRIEDMIYVNVKGKAEVLTKFPKDLKVV
jgi:Xaa-Pro aminopeptidase